MIDERRSTSLAQPVRHATVELHRHFEAGLTPETIATLAARNGVTIARTRSGRVVEGVDPQDPDSIRRYYATIAAGFGQPDGFAAFVDSFGLPLSVMGSLEDLEQAVFDQIVACAQAGSVHTELRGSPFTYKETIDAPLDEIARALVHGVDRAWTERQASGTFLLAFSRQKGLGAAPESPDQRQAPTVAALAAALHRADRPVGLDIAGFPETPYPPRIFLDALQPAREAGVPLTVHAGEQGRPPAFADAPPSLIVEAVTVLLARRIGHGTSLAASPTERDLVRERRIGVESCPLSNLRMGFVAALDEHPFKQFLDDGLLVSLSTDDPLMFGPFSVRDTFAELAAPLRLDERDLARATQNAIESAFVTEERRLTLHRLATPSDATKSGCPGVRASGRRGR